MAQIYVFGRVEEDLVVKTSQKNSPYVCFTFKEQTGKGRTQSYQVWAWNENVSRLVTLGVRKGSLLWLTGTMQLVDCTEEQGKVRTKVMKVFLANWGYLPTKQSASIQADVENETGQLSDSPIPPAEVMDGDRTALPE